MATPAIDIWLTSLKDVPTKYITPTIISSETKKIK